MLTFARPKASALVWLFFAVASPALAQRVRGTALLPDGATPLPGAIVQVKDARGAVAARALTNQRGAFAIALPRAGVYRVELLRIGYHPTLGPSVNVATGDSAVVTIVASGQAIALAAVDVRERETCRVSADSGLMVARVWEEARKAMLTTQLSSEAPLFAEWIEYDRIADSTARLVRTQTVRTERHPTTHAFKSPSAQLLDEKGYIVADAGATMYYAPDADALLSETFTADHCFRLEDAPRGSPGLIGVAFEPTRRRSDMKEIEGTLWVDRATAELRTLEFTYTNLPDAAEPAHSGGRIEFLRLLDGTWLIGRWNIRMPRLEKRDLQPDATRRVVMASSNLVLRAVQFTGGEVTRVFRGDSLLYRATGPALVVQVAGVDSMMRSAGAMISLDGTDYSATADTSGRIRISPVLAGRYRAHVHTPLMDTLHLPPIVGEVEARDGNAAHVDTLTLPSGRDVVAGACPRESIGKEEGLLHGRVTDTHAQPIDHAAVTVTWQSSFKTDVADVGYSEHTLGALTGSDGYWQICGVPRTSALFVRVAADSGTDLRRARLEESESLGTVDLVAHAESQAAREAAIASGPAARERALVEFAVLDTHAEPLANVTLDISAPGGVRRTLVTGPSGQALIPEMPPGRLVIRARRVGFKEGDVAAVVGAGRNTVPIILSEIAAPTLDTVRVVGDHRVFLSGMSRLDEFDQRRMLHEATVTFTHDDIVKRNPSSLWQMLTGVPSIRVVDIDSMVAAISARTNLPDFVASPPLCYMAIGINGQIMPHDHNHEAVDLRTLPVADEVYGIEVFAGAASIPLPYGGVGEGKWCGLVMIWTR